MSLVAQEMKYLFFIGQGTTAKRCCCGCSLRLGTQIITILSVIFAIINTIQSFNYNSYSMVYPISLIIYSIAMICSPILILISTFNNQFKFAHIGYIINSIAVYFYLIVILIVGIIMGAVLIPNSGHIDPAVITVFFVFFFIAYAIMATLLLYFNWILFSFTKELGLGNQSLLDGVDTNVGVNQQSNYVPPSNI